MKLNTTIIQHRSLQLYCRNVTMLLQYYRNIH